MNTQQSLSIKPKLYLCLLLVVLTLAVYWQVQNFDYVYYDDHAYVIQNAQVMNGLSLKGIEWAFKTTYLGLWHPISWLSLMFDSELYRGNPGGYHWTNLVFHIACTVLIFLVLCCLTGALWKSVVVAALFGLHPLHVEPVAWIASRKDVLSAFFFILALWFYAGYAEKQKMGHYFLVMLMFILGLMAKPMVVTLPFILLLLDLWPLNRFERFDQQETLTKSMIGGVWSRFRQFWLVGWNNRFLFLEKLPFLGVAVVMSIVMYVTQEESEAVAPLTELSIYDRIVNVCVAYAAYLGKTIWPVNLAVFYPHPGHWPLENFVAALVILTGLICFGLIKRRDYPYLYVGLGWYIITLLPVIGFVQIGAQSMADRYTYIPLIGIFIIVVWGTSYIVERFRIQQMWVGILSFCVLAALSGVAWIQLQCWKNGLTLFEHAIQATSGNYIAHNNLANHLLKRGDSTSAERQYREAIRIKPNFEPAYLGLGALLARQQKDTEAMAEFKKALIIKPDFATARFHLGALLEKNNYLEEALVQYREAVRFQPDEASFHNNLGVALLKLDRLKEATEEFQVAVQLKPDHAGAFNNLGMALSRAGKMEEASAAFREALRLAPDCANAQIHLSRIQQTKG